MHGSRIVIRWRLVVVAALAGGVLAAAVAAAPAPAAPADGPAPVRPGPSFLFAHDAARGTFQAVPGRKGVYRLALDGVPGSALMFSDRPYRLVGEVGLGHVLKRFFHTRGAALPNAAVTATDATTGRMALMGVELLGAAYDWKRRTLVYTVRVLREIPPQATGSTGRAARLLPARLGATSVFIDDDEDDYCDPDDPPQWCFAGEDGGDGSSSGDSGDYRPGETQE